MIKRRKNGDTHVYLQMISNSLTNTLFYCNPCCFDKSYDNPLFIRTISIHDNEEVCLESLYDNALDDGPMLLDVINYNATENRVAIMCPISFKSDQSSCFDVAKSGKEEKLILNFDPTILELDKNYVFIDHEKHALCDGYIVEFIHDATENYYERGKYGCRNFHGTRTPLFLLKVLKLLLFHLSMLVTLFYVNLFVYKIPMHRKWVRLKCVSHLLLDALFCFNSYFLREHLLKLLSLS